MAQHDYIIANQSGAAFRSDLNNGLAAIVSQNSGAAQPSTTYAYQWWADTTTGLLKIRNAANNAWITLFQLDGEWTTLALENGTAAAPSLYFKDSGTDTGLFSPGADQLAVATGGVERVEFGTTEVVFNDDGADVDFRVEGDTNASLFKIDAGLDQVQVANLNGGPLAGTRNRIINGDMRIDQRNAGASVTPTDGQYSVDRWTVGLTQASKFSLQQSTTAPAGFTNSLLATSLSAYTVGVSDEFEIMHRIEGNNVSDFAWGTASASTVTLSFWVRSSLTGTFGGSVNNGPSITRSYAFSYSISAANTWEYKQITLSGDTSGTWNTNTSTGVTVLFSLGAGSNVVGTAGSWGGTFQRGVTGQTNLVGTSGATLYITGVQLETGTVATPFERRPFTQEQILCARYYHTNVEIGTLPNKGGGTYFDGVIATVVNGGTSQATMYRFPVPMRAAPTITIWSPNNGAQGQAWSEITQTNFSYSINAGSKQLYSGNNPTGSGISGNAYYFHYAASAEL